MDFDLTKKHSIIYAAAGLGLGIALVLVGQTDWAAKLGGAFHGVVPWFCYSTGIGLIIGGPLGAIFGYKYSLRTARHFARTKPCPTCSHRCAQNATSCPKCGHIFPAEITSPDSETSEGVAAAPFEVSPPTPEGD
jgi:hypothetical protein